MSGSFGGITTGGTPTGWDAILSINDSAPHPILIFRLKSGVGNTNILLKSIYASPVDSTDSCFIRVIKNPTITGSSFSYTNTNNNSKLEVGKPALGTDVTLTAQYNLCFSSIISKPNNGSGQMPIVDINASIGMLSSDVLAITLARTNAAGTDTWYVTGNFLEFPSNT